MLKTVNENCILRSNCPALLYFIYFYIIILFICCFLLFIYLFIFLCTDITAKTHHGRAKRAAKKREAPFSSRIALFLPDDG